MSLNTELQKSVLSALIELYTIDLNPIGVNEVFYLTPTPNAKVERRNLLTFTEDLRNTAEAGATRPWSQFNDTGNEVAVTIGHADPIGGTGASKLTATTGLQVQRQVSQTPNPLLVGNSFATVSVYAKAAECQHLRLYISTRTATTNFPFATFNLQNGTFTGFGTSNGFTMSDARIESVGDGWYRCSASLADVGSGGVSGGSAILQMVQSNGAAFDPVNAGEGLFLWGAQLEYGPLTQYQAVPGSSWWQPYPDAIRFDGNTYIAFPIQGDGFETASNGSPPQPTLRISNVTKYIQSYLGLYQDLVGAKVTRFLTFKNLLDTPSEVFGQQVYLVHQLVSQTKDQIEFKLCSVLDNKQIKLPREQVLRNEFPGAGLFRAD
jgi:phage-related protein